MNGGQALRIAERSWEDGPPSIPDLDSPSPAPVSATRARRAEASTMPSSEPFPSLHDSRADWCVDVGAALLTMTTFELWAALEDRAVLPSARVWREGMECWTPVRDLPELRWASANDVPASKVAPKQPDPTPTASPPAIEETPAPAEPTLTQQAATPAPPPDAPRDLPARAISRPTSRPSVAPASPRFASSGARWLFAGSVVAALAIGLALLRAPSAAPIEEPHASVAAPLQAAVSPIPVSPGGARTPEVVADPPAAEPQTPAVRREERGQRRLPRGGRRAQGR